MPVRSEREKMTKAKNDKSNATKINGNVEAAEKLTPYQGARRAFGLFTCKKCNRQWGSANSWANMGQDCRECLINVYPRAQWKLEKSRRPAALEPGKEHPTEMCEKCKVLGYSCRQRARDNDRGSDVSVVETKKKRKRSRKSRKKAQPAA